jgi:glycyl-tRNA synthetase beta chain
VAEAIEDHYRPRFAGDALPRGEVGVCVALADKLETLVGLFSVGEKPTGDKDPFALRRHALGVIRMLMERKLPLEVPQLIESAAGSFPAVGADALQAVELFIYERLAGVLRDAGHRPQAVDAVLALSPTVLADVEERLAAVRTFAALPESASLAAANKRVGNILRKTAGAVSATVDPARFVEPAEKALFAALEAIAPRADAAFEAGDYTASLSALAALKAPIDAFFDSVMVNTDDAALRANRLALLARLHATLNRVADLARLAA